MNKEKNNIKKCQEANPASDKTTKIRYKSIIIDDTKYRTLLNTKFENRKVWKSSKIKEIKAFIPGKIQDIKVTQGQNIKKGDTLLVLEAMKMYNQLISHENGIIRAIKVKKDQCVIKNQVLIELE